MVWSPETSQGFESRKIRDTIAEHLKGTVFDIGCGDERIFPAAIGVDMSGKDATFLMDFSNPQALEFFGKACADVVFSSHTLEDIIDYEGLLQQFHRMLKPGGKVILYLPHPELYPNIGEDGANPNHVHDFRVEQIIEALNRIGTWNVLRNEVRDQEDEYSFLIVAEKVDTGIIRMGLVSRPSERRPAPRVIVVRYGGIGDALQASGLFRRLKERGYYTIANVSDYGQVVLANNPFVDEVLMQSRHAIPATELGPYHAELRRKYDADMVNLCESVERTLLFEERDEDLFWASHEERHAKADVNYLDRTLELASLPTVRPLLPELYLSPTEQALSAVFKERHKGFFNVQWQLSGSSWHKIYPFADQVIDRLVNELPGIQFFLSGPRSIEMVAWNHPRVHSRMRIWGVRAALVMPANMDLVVSPETGVLWAATAHGTPSIAMLTHSSEKNLTRDWPKCTSFQSLAPCSPCHRLVETLENCPLDKTYNLPVCMSEGHPMDRIADAITEAYKKWDRL